MSGGIPHSHRGIVFSNVPTLGIMPTMAGSFQTTSAGGNTFLSVGRFAPQPSPPRHKPDPRQPDTLGWRVWRWDGDVLVSPVQGTPWPRADLSTGDWHEEQVLRGVAGIHAHLVPRHWKIIAEMEQSPGEVSGIVERYGRFVLGTDGWRAEQVVIRELLAPSTEIGLKLEQLYPDAIIHYPEEEKEPCISETSSRLASGSRTLLLPLPAPSIPLLSPAQQAQAEMARKPSPPLLPNPSLSRHEPRRPDRSWIPIVAGAWACVGALWGAWAIRVFG